MPSEYAPGGSKPRMTKAQIKKLQDEQQEATRIANKKIADAKKSEEFKKEKYILNSLENVLNNDDNLIASGVKELEDKNMEEKELSFWDKIILWFKKILKYFFGLFVKKHIIVTYLTKKDKKGHKKL